MKALTIKGVKQFELIEKDIPTLKEDQALIKVSKAGICGSDIHMVWAAGYRPSEDFVIGHEFSGTIVDPGTSKDLKVGDRVVAMEITPCGECDYCKNNQPQLCSHVLDGGPGIGSDGGYGQYVAVRQDMIRKLPDNVTDVAGALVEPASISMHACKMAQVKEGSKVLVSGGGAIGLFAAACAYALGASEVVVTEVNPERIRLANEASFVTHALDGASEHLKDQLKDIAPEGFDSVIECSGHPVASSTALASLSRGGTMTLVAYGQQPQIDLFTFINTEQHLTGSVFFTFEDFELVIDLMSQGKLNLEPYAKLIHLEDVQQTLLDLESGKENAIKYVIDMQ